MKQYFKTILKDKQGAYSLREIIIAVSMFLILMSWIAQLVFNIPTPEFMFYSIISLIATGCFGYSIEKNTNDSPTHLVTPELKLNNPSNKLINQHAFKSAPKLRKQKVKSVNKG